MDIGAYKATSLRNIEVQGPYMHDGRFESLEDALDHYRNPPPQALAAGELMPLDLSDRELDELAAFHVLPVALVALPAVHISMQRQCCRPIGSEGATEPARAMWPRPGRPGRSTGEKLLSY